MIRSSYVSTPLSVWFYILCGIIVLQTQLSTTQGNCRDVWPNCKAFTTSCKKNEQVRLNCKITCGLCGGSGSRPQGRSGARSQSKSQYTIQGTSRQGDPAWYQSWVLKKSYIARNKGLTSVPTDIPPDAEKEVVLDANKIEHIKKSDFSRQSKMLSLSINNNKISQIDDYSFSTLQLQVLNLRNNKISTITRYTFCDRIGRLDLEKNLIPRVTVDMFNHITVLESLTLAQNHIKTIEAGSFTRLTRLRYLGLDHNKLTTLSADIFAQGRFDTTISWKVNFISMRLDDNPIVCDHRMRWFVEAMPTGHIDVKLDKNFKCNREEYFSAVYADAG